MNSILDQLQDLPPLAEAEQLKRSVADNIRLLLASRPPRLNGHSHSEGVLGFGLETRLVSPGQAQLRHLCQRIQQLIEQYEPRLQDVQVVLDEVDNSHNTIVVLIEGGLIQHGALQPASFGVALDLGYVTTAVEDLSVV